MPVNFQICRDDEGASITVFVAGESPRVIRDDRADFDKVVAAALADDPNVLDLIDKSQAVAERFENLSERVAVRGGYIYFDGDEINNALTKQVLRHLEADVEDWRPLVNFFEKVQTNTNEHSREQLYGFVERNEITITDDGDIVFYKGVRRDVEDPEVYRPLNKGYGIVDSVVYRDEFLPQRIGSVVEIPRSMVRHDPHTACHTGLHAATFDFARDFGNGVVLEIHVNPRDVVSVPNAANKIRCCRYLVVKEIEQSYDTPVLSADTPILEDHKEVRERPKRVRYPKPADFERIVAEAKSKKKGLKSYAATHTNWVLVGDDPKDRKSWAVQPKAR